MNATTPNVDTIICGDCLEEMGKLPDRSIDAIVTDPPYFLLNDSGQGFMGKEWESLNRKKSIDIICKSKEFAHFVERIFTLLKVESNLEEASSVLETANTKDNDKSILSRPIVPYVEKKSKDSPRTSKANTNSVQGIALTRGALLDLLKGLSRSPITAIESQPENALFAVPSLFIESLIKKHAPRSASTSNLKQAVDAKEQEIPLTSTEDQRIKNVIAVMSGKICESKSMQETSLAACSVGSTAGTMRYKLITSEDIKNPSTTEWIIWSLYAIDAMQRSSSTGRIFTDFLNSDLVYQFHKQWAEEAIRVLKPGGHLLSFGGTRSYHTMAMAIEDAGFECRDMLEWCYGSGFPKSLNISKQLSQEDAKKWGGFGSAIKPAHEPVVLARKPLDGCTIAENVLRWGCGGLNVDGCRINPGESVPGGGRSYGACEGVNEGWKRPSHAEYESKPSHNLGRFPSNLIHDASPAVLAEFAKAGERKVGFFNGHRNKPKTKNDFGIFKLQDEAPSHEASTGSAARFFMACEFTPADYAPIVYYAKAAPSERNGSTHPTMKPLSLMQYLCRLITPPGGLILDPFGGSGTTGIAAMKEGFHYILIEQQEEYCEIARKRIAAVPARLDRWAEAEG